jgi:hypothetical protein
MKTIKEKKLEVALLKEKLERVSGKKIIFTEKTISTEDFVSKIENSSKNSIVDIEYITTLKMNKTGLNSEEKKIQNPYYGIIEKSNIITGKINFNYKDEKEKFNSDHGIENSEETIIKKRTWGEKTKEGSSVVEKNGQYYLEMIVEDTAKPTFYNSKAGEEISKEELKPFMLNRNYSSEREKKIPIRTFKFSSIKSIILNNNKEYQVK